MYFLATILNWNFKLQPSNFRDHKSQLSFCTSKYCKPGLFWSPIYIFFIAVLNLLSVGLGSLKYHK